MTVTGDASDYPGLSDSFSFLVSLSSVCSDQVILISANNVAMVMGDEAETIDVDVILEEENNCVREKSELFI